MLWYSSDDAYRCVFDSIDVRIGSIYTRSDRISIAIAKKKQ